MPDLSEAQIEAQISDVLTRHGRYPVKTDAALVILGWGRVSRSHIPQGFPDMTYLLALPGTPLGLAALVETKAVTGQLSDARVEKHAELHDQYGLHAHVLREPPPALALVTEARRVVGLLRDRQRGRAGVRSEQPKQTAPHAFQVLVFPRPWADGVAAHLGGDVAADGGV